MNSLAGTIHEDFLKMPLARKGIVNDGLILKILVVIIGVMSTLLVYVVENMGGMMSLAIGLGSVAHGPLFGMFFMGMFFPRANRKVSNFCYDYNSIPVISFPKQMFNSYLKICAYNLTNCWQ